MDAWVELQRSEAVRESRVLMGATSHGRWCQPSTPNLRQAVRRQAKFDALQHACKALGSLFCCCLSGMGCEQPCYNTRRHRLPSGTAGRDADHTNCGDQACLSPALYRPMAARHLSSRLLAQLGRVGGPPLGSLPVAALQQLSWLSSASRPPGDASELAKQLRTAQFQDWLDHLRQAKSAVPHATLLQLAQEQ